MMSTDGEISSFIRTGNEATALTLGLPLLVCCIAENLGTKYHVLQFIGTV